MSRTRREMDLGEGLKAEVVGRIGKGPVFVTPLIPEAEVAKSKADILSERFLKSGKEVLAEVGKEIADMPIAASRFSPTRQIKENIYRGHRTTYEDATEAEAKRIQLQAHLDSIRGEYEALSDRLGRLVTDIEATKLEG